MSRGLSLRARWALSVGVAVVLLVALIVYVGAHNTDAPRGQPISPHAQAEAALEAIALAEQEQAPHRSRVPARLAPARALPAVVTATMRGLIDSGQADPPLGRVGCTPDGGAGPRRAFRCRALSANVYYDFQGVLDGAARAVTLCRVQPPPYPARSVPVSRRCQA